MFKVFSHPVLRATAFFSRQKVRLLFLGIFYDRRPTVSNRSLATPGFIKKIRAGILWVAALLASLLVLETWLSSDLEDQALEQLLLCGFPCPG